VREREPLLGDPALELKMGRPSLPKGQLKKLYTLSGTSPRWPTWGHWLPQAVRGDAAFAHKGGCTCPPSAPPEDVRARRAEVVGNHRRV